MSSITSEFYFATIIYKECSFTVQDFKFISLSKIHKTDLPRRNSHDNMFYFEYDSCNIMRFFLIATVNNLHLQFS